MSKTLILTCLIIIMFYTSNPKPSNITSSGYWMKESLTQINKCSNIIVPRNTTKSPPCVLDKTYIDLTLTQHNINITNNIIDRSNFAKLKHKYCKYQAVYIDGSKISIKMRATAIDEQSHQFTKSSFHICNWVTCH